MGLNFIGAGGNSNVIANTLEDSFPSILDFSVKIAAQFLFQDAHPDGTQFLISEYNNSLNYNT